MPTGPRRRASDSPQAIARTRRRHLWLLTAITLFVYIGALPGHFLWNDQKDLVQGDMRITSGKDVLLLATHTLPTYAQRHDGGTEDLHGGAWRPLAVLANSLSWGLWHQCTICWHLESLLWHLLAVIGSYILGRELLNRRRNGNGLAFWAAALFAAHTANVPAVAWLQARPELISAALAIASLALFSRLPATTRIPRGHVIRWLGGCGLLSLGAMLSAESSYVLPLLALLLASTDAIQHNREPITGIAPLRLQAIGIVLLALISVLLFRAVAVEYGMQFAGQYPTGSLIANLGTGLRHFWALIGQALLPGEPILSDVWKISTHWGIDESLTLIGTAAVLIVTLFGLRQGNPAAFGVAWFLLWISSGAGLFPTVHYHNELSLYPATWGISLAVVYLVSRAWRPIGRQLVRGSEVVLFLPLLAVIMALSMASNARWWNEQALFSSELAVDPYYFGGRIQLAHQALTQHKATDALTYLQTALETYQKGKYTGYLDKAELYRLMGEAQLQLKLYREAATSLRKALVIRPSSATNWRLLGRAQLGTGQFASAKASLDKASGLRPDDPAIQADQGILLIARGHTQAGVKRLQAMLQQPGTNDFERQFTLGKGLIDLGRFDAAIKHLKAALKERNSPDVHAALALALWHQGEHERARTELAIAETGQGVDQDYLARVRHTITPTTSADGSVAPVPGHPAQQPRQ